jgi:hypothetical protein
MHGTGAGHLASIGRRYVAAAVVLREPRGGFEGEGLTAMDRRTFLKMAGAPAVVAAFPGGLGKALAIPANTRTGSIRDVEHIVFLMQENRSFDHYFGAMRGVRGFADPHPVTLPLRQERLEPARRAGAPHLVAGPHPRLVRPHRHHPGRRRLRAALRRPHRERP